MPTDWTPRQRATISAAAEAVAALTGPLSQPELSTLLTATMVVAAWHETRLGEHDGGDGGQSWGPWQCHTTRGVGIGHAPHDLARPEYSAPLMLAEMQAQDARTGLLSAALAGTARDWVAIWNAEVERPGAHGGVRMTREAVGRARAQTLDDWWPGTADLPAWGWLTVPPASRR